MIIIATIFIVGLSIGSFLNVLIDRLPRGESVIGKRSHCELCKKNIVWHDLIPLVSFIALKGKCRHCHSPIGWQYPTVELLTGILFAMIVFFLPDKNLSFIIYHLSFISAFIVIFSTDLKYGIIPDKIIYPAIVVSLIYNFYNYHNFYNYLLAGVGTFLFFLAIFLVTRGAGMGFGDVKLSLLMGLFLGFPKIIVALYAAFLTGAVISLILVIWGKKKLRGGVVPFGPFLAAGWLISFFWGEKIIQTVLDLHLLS